MNRDYFARPIQAHSRTVHDYGNTRLGVPEYSPRRDFLGLLAIAPLLAIGFWLLWTIAP